MATKRSSLGRRLRHDREALGMSLRELAAKSGVSVANCSHIETGYIKDPRVSTVRKLARGLRCDPSWLAWGE